MGYYINPSFGTKEEWLAHNAAPVRDPDSVFMPEDFYFVCLVDNGEFTAAAIAYSKDEFDYFRSGQRNGSDRRPFRWFYAHRETLEAVCPEVKGKLR